MRATIQFINPDGKLALATRLPNIIKGIKNLRQHILAHGILLERLSPDDVAALQEMLSRESGFTYLTSESTIRVRVTDGDLRALLGLGLVVPLPHRHNQFADIFWERGFTIEKLEQRQADDLRNQIEAIATVTLTADVAQTHFCTVSGQVFHTDGVPLSTRGFTVRAFDSVAAGLPTPRLVPCGTTATLQANANYLIDYAWQPDGRKGPNLIVRVFDQQGSVVAEVEKRSAAIQEYLDITAEGLGIVRGIVHGWDNTRAAGVTVLAFDRNLREETLLGSTVTDVDGFYEITYSNAQFRLKKAQPDLIIRVFASASGVGNAAETGDELAVSAIVFNAPHLYTLDLEVRSRNDPSEYERHLAELQPLIEGEAVQLLTDEDLRFLSGKTDIPFDQLNYLRLDAQWTFQYALEPAMAYGLFRQELPTNLARLLAEKPARLREALKTSVARNVVPASIGDPAIEQLLALADSPASKSYARTP
ncbi:hypothetical protein C8R31_102367 [Nitrosospira sp. Nsp2]|uniref:hypothetical protein n=1 Tax=Nitrosospira sp. Nsp2 TaxID=136548 RepID=UPI000D325479|nr:hypothetical protein [Nitrosospira sp. Nsp2]PTR16353.1 hypothetical protein C8R31_102367 [Nitrosospira sp. Nsp2]